MAIYKKLMYNSCVGDKILSRAIKSGQVIPLLIFKS